MAAKTYKGFDQKLSLFIQILSKCRCSLWICDENTYWLYYIFPTFWAAAIRGVKIFLVTVHSIDPKENYRRWLLKQIGTEIYVTNSLPFHGFLFDPDKDTRLALVSNKESAVNSYLNYTEETGRVYSASFDAQVIHSFWNLLEPWQKQVSSITPKQIFFQTCSQTEFFEKLRCVEQYKYAKFSLQIIDINNVMLLQRYIKEYKFLQINQLITNLYTSGKFELFEPLKLTFEDDTSSIITPPVLETKGEKLIVIEGNTRIFYCLQNGLSQIKVVVVDNVEEPLPGEPLSITDVSLTSLTLPLDSLIYKLDQQKFRKIEEKIHL
ncbi:hypothetical protein NIES4075_67340 [Tolypothrix sp. NIES-4075]|uniref:hypothetical protein n=1 Tax=Tolypothrix sp. NIES-4075 TaxID=2005459 RepID=UPI000B5CA4C0|nr:hypothetical protein [Tolypothrix sp. NIES-4075]GAX45713.1 hypothetical protein NIES4075_67340 [Tolypothrix sp. NIES-4075]